VSTLSIARNAVRRIVGINDVYQGALKQDYDGGQALILLDRISAIECLEINACGQLGS